MIENLTTEQRDSVLRFLLHRMGMDTRGALMANLPVAYATLYPGTGATVRVHVTAAIRGAERAAEESSRRAVASQRKVSGALPADQGAADQGADLYQVRSGDGWGGGFIDQGAAVTTPECPE